ncbi:MAG: hypothetical protein KY468_02280 [Armatimonadetes bacterium]|nr:hypothetical protein [Armatimonadota bacterium]
MSMETRDVLTVPSSPPERETLLVGKPLIAPPDSPPPSETARGITRRSILLGLALIPLNVYWVGTIEGVWHGLHFTCLSLAMNVVFILLALMVVNSLLGRVRPNLVLSQAELMTIFSMLAVSSVLCGHDRLVTLMGVVAHATRYVTPENKWDTLFMDYLPGPLVIQNEAAARYYYDGGSSFWATGYWRYWVVPALMWTSFWGALVGMMFCLTAVLRQRWSESERLSYPIIQIPLAMTEPGGVFWRNRWMWIGFGFAAALDTLSGLAFLFPSIPALTYQGPALEMGPNFTSRPWSAIGSLRLDVYPFMVGIAYLLPTHLIFSTWFFYLVGKAQMVLGSAWGIQELSPQFPYHGMQSAGAVIALGLTALWEARGYLGQVWLRVAGRPSEVSDAKEAMSYRAAVFGFGIGFFWVSGFSVWIGMSPVLIVPYFLIFFLVALTVARLRADTGIPAHGLTNVNPQDILITFSGTGEMSRPTLTTMSLFAWFNRFNRAHPMPVALESLKAASVLRVEQRRMMSALLLATVFTLLCGFAIYPALMYRHGAALAAELNWTGWAVYGSLASWVQSPKKPDPMGMGFFAGGGGFAVLLMFLRTRIVGFPFHPMGYALGVGGTVDRWWMALLVCSVVKGCIIRYTGMKGYRQAIPFFMGLVIGQYVVSCIWAIIAMIVNEPMYWSWTG